MVLRKLCQPIGCIKAPSLMTPGILTENFDNCHWFLYLNSRAAMARQKFKFKIHIDTIWGFC